MRRTIALASDSTNSVITAKFLEDTFSHLKIKIFWPLIVLCNSAAALDNARRLGSANKSRHLELKDNITRSYVETPHVQVVQISTAQILADMLTKALSAPAVAKA